MTQRFAGQVALVSGAAGGFGRLAALQLAQEGAKLVLTDVRADALAAVVAEVEAVGTSVAALAGDVALEATHAGLATLALQRFGQLDLALNNAGLAHGLSRLADVTLDEASQVIAVDLFGVFLAMRAQLPLMAQKGRGVILNVASVAGLVGAPMMSVYSAAKHGVIGLTKSAAGEYAGKGIRINAICPSFAETPMVTSMLDNGKRPRAEAEVRLTSLVPLRRLAEPQEVVEAMLWMLSPANSFMTGHALALDGGLSAI